MQLIRKTLAFGRLPNVKGDLYVPTTGRKGFVHNITLHNANTADETVVLNYHDGTHEYVILNEVVPAGDSLYLDFRGEGEVVDDGAKITGNTTTASKVTYKFSGTEEIPDAVASGGGSAAGVSSNLWAPPTSGHTEDDEFESDTLGAEWSVTNMSDDVAGTFSSGTCDPYDTTFTSGTVVRVNPNAQTRPSWMLMQPPAISGKRFTIYKDYTFPTNVLVVARLRFSKRIGSLAEDGNVGIGFFTASSGRPQEASSFELYLNEPEANECEAEFRYFTAGGSAAGVTVTTSTSSQGQALEYVALHKIGTTYHGWVGTASGNWIWINSFTQSFAIDQVGIIVGNAEAASPGVKVHGIDFMRFYETDKFLL